MAYSEDNLYELKATIRTDAGHGVTLATITDALRSVGLQVMTATVRGVREPVVVQRPDGLLD